jgi:hypothetical protein
MCIFDKRIDLDHLAVAAAFALEPAGFGKRP